VPSTSDALSLPFVRNDERADVSRSESELNTAITTPD
jgi:hypothetical protein